MRGTARFEGSRTASSADREASIVEEEIAMGLIDKVRGPGEAERADPSDKTVVNGAPYDGHPVTPSGTENLSPVVGRPDAPIAEEIKRRQISLAVRYVAALRAR